MKSLKKYLVKRNAYCVKLKSFGIVGEEMFPTDPTALTAEQLAKIASNLARDMSPEALYQDGERSHSAAMKVKAQLELVIADMKTLGVEVQILD